MPFDPSAFIDQAAGPMSTTFETCPEGEFRLLVGDTDIKTWFKEINTKNGPRHIVSVPFEVLDDNVRATLDRDKVYTKQDIWLDLDPSGRISTEKGKNVALGQLREALGQNADPNWTFAKLRGAGPLMGKVTQRPDKDNPEKKYSEVSRTARIA